jgi:hypothetical protein
MSTTTSAAATTAPASAGQSRSPRPRHGTPRLQTGGVSRQARQQAAAILEVLAGVRTPMEVAQPLAISRTRYSIIEGRALQGLVAACEPRPQGRVRAPAGELTTRRRECEQLRRQVARQQALLRLTERTAGLAGAPPAGKSDITGPKKKRQRKPKARALQAAAVLQQPAAAAPSDQGLSP